MTKPNSAAFAAPSSRFTDASFGLTIREYYAGLIMQGLLSNPEAVNTLAKVGADGSVWADMAVNHADALIDRLNQEDE